MLKEVYKICCLGVGLFFFARYFFDKSKESGQRMESLLIATFCLTASTVN